MGSHDPAGAGAGRPVDDVIRIRIDTAQAVKEFLALLAAQRAEGETCAPANPANRAVYRELAPFRLVEYGYVDPDAKVDGAYLGFPDGSIYAAGDDIPEPVVDRMLADHRGDWSDLAPVYVYILLSEPAPPAELDQFSRQLSLHLSQPLVCVYRGEDGRMAGHGCDGDTPASASAMRDRLEAQVVKSVLEANRHLPKARILERFAQSSQAGDGRAFAALTFNFSKHRVEFASPADRDDFIAWTRRLCERIYAKCCGWPEMGADEVFRPADPTPLPPEGEVVTRLLSPARFDGGRPWSAFGGTDAATAMPADDGLPCPAPQEDGARKAAARDYWAYVTETVTGVEASARRRQART